MRDLVRQLEAVVEAKVVRTRFVPGETRKSVLSSRQLIVLRAVANGKDDLADATGLSADTVASSLASLNSSGHITPHDRGWVASKAGMNVLRSKGSDEGQATSSNRTVGKHRDDFQRMVREGRETEFRKKCPPAKPVKTPGHLAATGNCYEKAAHELMFGKAQKGWVLVHGRPTLQLPPFIEFGHGWLEKGEQVWDPQSGFKGPRALYYSIGQIEHRNNLVYTPEEVRIFLVSHKHWGPWEGVDGVKMTAKQKRDWGRSMPKRSKRSTKPSF